MYDLPLLSTTFPSHSHHYYSPARKMDTQKEALILNLARKPDHVHKFVMDIEPLKVDGSNIGQWKLQTATTISDMTGIPCYWELPPPNPDSRTR